MILKWQYGLYSPASFVDVGNVFTFVLCLQYVDIQYKWEYDSHHTAIVSASFF
jgi:hypothetical protein